MNYNSIGEFLMFGMAKKVDKAKELDFGLSICIAIR